MLRVFFFSQNVTGSDGMHYQFEKSKQHFLKSIEILENIYFSRLKTKKNV